MKKGHTNIGLEILSSTAINSDRVYEFLFVETCQDSRWWVLVLTKMFWNRIIKKNNNFFLHCDISLKTLSYLNTVSKQISLIYIESIIK